MTTKRIVATNQSSGNVRVYRSARAASKALNGKGTVGSEKTITRLASMPGGGLFRNTWITYE